MNAILVCVGLDDILSLTLPYNRHHFDRIVVATTPQDGATHRVAEKSCAEVFVTEAFYEGRAYFRKWLALERGLDYMGREGAICILDCDIVLPKEVSYPATWEQKGTTVGGPRNGTISQWAASVVLRNDCLFCPRRRMMEDLVGLAKQGLPCENLWQTLPLHPGTEFAGYCQIFDAADRHLPKGYWYQTDWIHAGGADSFFAQLWPESHRVRPNWEVLHLGSCGRNWMGRVSNRLDGTPVPGSGHRNVLMQEMLRRRRENPPDDRYRGERLSGG